MRSTLTAAVFTALFVSAAAAQPAATIHPRVVAESIARNIEENYFNPTRAQTIAAALRASAAHGDYDRDTAPLDLAAALTATLHPYDGHFTVRYDPRPAAPPPASAPQAPPSDPSLALENYGFRRVDLLAGGIGVIAMNQFADIDPDAPADPARQAADAAIQAVSGARAIIGVSGNRTML